MNYINHGVSWVRLRLLPDTSQKSAYDSQKREELLKLSEELLNMTRDNNKNSEKIYETTYRLRKLTRELYPSKSDALFQMQDDLFIEQRRKNGYKWFGMK